MTDPGPRPRVGLPTKLFYGSGSVAFGVKDTAFKTLLLLYYNQVVGLPAQWVAAAIMIALIVDSVIDPIVGQFSDTLRSPWGRRHPLMYAAALPAALSFLLIWNPPAGWSDPALTAYLIVVAVIVRSFITFYEIPSAALAAELTSDYDERTSLLSFRYFFGWWGGLSLIFLTLTVFLRPTAEYPVGQLNAAGYRQFAVLGAVIMFTSILVSAAGTHRFVPWLRQPPPRGPRRSLGATLAEMRRSLSNRPFMTMAGVGLITQGAEGVTYSMYSYLSTYFWELSPDQMAILLLDAFIGAAVALRLAPILSKRAGKRTAAMVLLAGAISLVLAPLGLRLLGVFPDNQSPALLPTLFVIGAVRAAMGITAAILISSMIADVVESSELETGRRSEGLFFSALSLISKAVSGVGVFVAGLLLAVIQFPDGAKPGQVDPEIIRNLALVLMPTVFVLYGVALFLISRYRITRETHEDNLRQLAARAQPAE